ncbi:MAG TPA: hypothetical protein VHX37_01090 [Acidobacteriaceae bacterium]|jgi:hypothetical protein|nr:hypothetical protein [Acidobacteriaceae bacterium]
MGVGVGGVVAWGGVKGSGEVGLDIPNSSLHKEVERLCSLKPWVFF